MEKNELIKRIYYLCVYYRWDMNKIRKVVLDDLLIEEAQKYGEKLFKDEDMYQFIECDLFTYLEEKNKDIFNKYNNGYYYILDMVYKSDKYNSILLKFLNCKKFSYVYLKEKIRNYPKLYTRENEKFSEIENKLKGKFKYFDDFMNSNRLVVSGYFNSIKKEKQFERYSREIECFVNLNIEYAYSIAEFCNSRKISIEDFKNMVDFVRKKNKELYCKYILIETALNCGIESSYLFKFGDLYKYISFGINDKGDYGDSMNYSGEYRQFDILDYYLIFKVDPVKFSIFSKCIENKHKNSMINEFFIKNIKAYDMFDYDTALNYNVEYGCEFDENGLPIEGSGISLDIDTKKKILDFLVENNIPFNSNIIHLAYTKYINGQLEIDNKKIKK